MPRVRIKLYSWGKVRDTAVQLLVRDGSPIPSTLHVRLGLGPDREIVDNEWTLEQETDSERSEAKELGDPHVMQELAERGYHLCASFVKLVGR